MRYEAPETVESAAALLAAESGDARVLAGGTDLLVQMRSDIVEPALIVDIKRIAAASDPRVHVDAANSDRPLGRVHGPVLCARHGRWTSRQSRRIPRMLTSLGYR